MIVTTETTTRTVSVTPELAHRPPTLTAPTTIHLTATQPCPKLDPAHDYIINLPAAPYTPGLTLNGGRNILLVGGEITTTANRALYTVGNTGTVYAEGVKITGPDTKDAICIDSRLGGTVILQNIAVPDGIHGTQDGYHADLIQTWAGPGRLLVDHFYGRSDYQGFFLIPNNQWTGWTGTDVDLRHVHLDMAAAAGYGLYVQPDFPVLTHEVYVTPRSNPAQQGRDWNLWPKGDPRWAGVTLEPPPVPFVDLNMVGVGYRSVWGS